MSVRDIAWEAETLNVAGELSQRVHGKTSPSFAREVELRLAVGQDIYGLKYMDIDCIAEAAEEPLDVPAYLLLELQKLQSRGMRDEDFQELRMLALEAMAASVAVHETLLRMKRARDEIVPQS